MRYSVSRSLSAVLMFFAFILPVSFFGQDQDSKKSTLSSGKPTAESIVLNADEGPTVKVRAHIRKERRAPGLRTTSNENDPQSAENPNFSVTGHPREDRLVRGHAFYGDLRTLPQIPPEKFERPEREEPQASPMLLPGTETSNSAPAAPVQSPPSPRAPAPAPSSSFDGLDFASWGAGHPPDANGDVGPTYYIQAINTSVGIYRKSDSVLVAAFTFNTLMSQGSFNNVCDTNNLGDPVVLYDTFEDRWIITDLAFQLDGAGNVINPPGAFECFAVSKAGDPVAGGWNFYSIHVTGGFGDYPKLAVWPDGLYMSANVFGYPAGGAFQNPRVWALNKAQMYAGAPSVQVIFFDAPSDFTILPSNARLQTGTPPPGTPNYFLSTWEFINSVTVYKFQVNWASPLQSTFTGPNTPLAATSWPNTGVPNAPSQGGNSLDVLQLRAMAQNQYTNLGGVESLWATHTVRRGNTSGFAAPRYYQVDVTGGIVAANIPQAATWDPDAANVIYRFMPSVAVDRAGNMALGYSTSSSTSFPAIKYAGRLATDPVNTLSQSEQVLIQGTGTQVGNCGTSSCIRWGDYSAMTLDPDGCTFWYTNMYYAVRGLNFLTRIGSFSFPSCTQVGAGGSVQGTVTATASGASIRGASVALGSRTTTTDSNGNYTFLSIPGGTYPSITASDPGYLSSTVASTVVTDGGTSTQNFSLSLAPTSGCLVDTTQADFQTGAITNCDLTSSPGDITLLNAPSIDQHNTTLSNSGVGLTVTTWGGQTFTPAVTGQLTRADINLFCSGCTGTTPNLILSLRATSGGLPTGADLASATFTGSNSNAAGYFTANFTSPPTLTAATQYALLVRPTANPSGGIYALTRSSTSVYAGGTRVSSTDSGTVWSTPLTAGQTTDAGFKTYMNIGFASSGTFVSSAKDANPNSNSSSNWGTISWTADTPTGTNVQFQAAASNNPSGVFSFVGPDGTAATFFTNGGSLTQFNGSRYLKYQASFTTTSGAATPVLHDVTICFSDMVTALATTLTVASATGPYGGTVNLSATLTASSTGVSGKTVSFTLNGNGVGSGTTDGSGIATVPSVSLAGIQAGSYPGVAAATFVGDSGYTTSNGTATLTVSRADQTITFGALSSKNFGDPDFAVSATASSSLPVSFSVTGSCSAAGSTVHLTGPGSCTITASQSGDSNHNPAPAIPQSVTIQKALPLVLLSCSPAVFDTNTHACTAAATGIGNVMVSGATTVSYNSNPAPPANAGTYSVSASFISGDSNYSNSTGISSLTIAKAVQTIAFLVLVTRTFGGPDFAVSATASSSLTVGFSAGGNCSVTGSMVHLTGVGSCTITALQAGNANYNPAPSIPRSFAISLGGDFTIALTLPSVIVTAGQPATEHITITPNVATLTPLTLTCSGLPAKASCTFAPNPVPAGSAATDVVMTITTTAPPASALQHPPRVYANWLGFTSMGLIGVVVVGVRRKSRKKAIVLCAFSLLVLLMAIGCGSRQQTPTIPSGASTVTVTGSTTSFTHSTTFTLTVN
jgi:hypothetical protein